MIYMSQINDATSMSAFAQLAQFKDQLAASSAAKALAAAQAAAKAEKLLREARLFVDAVGHVQTLKQAPRATVPSTPPAPFAKQRALDDQQVMRDSLSDHFGVEQLLETDVDLSYRADGIGIDVLNKLRRGDWAVQGQLDLHGLRVEQARLELAQFIKLACEQGIRCVRVVHGKGLGSKDKQPVLKGKVRSWLVQKQEVLGFVAARAAEGGNGALVVLLKG